MKKRNVAAILLCGIFACHKPSKTSTDVSDPVDYANPFMGSGGFGFAAGSAFPGALAPQGLVKVGPDTNGPFGDINFLHYSGYWFGDDTIRGFSHLHLHGTGATDYGVLSLMPVANFDSVAPVASSVSTFAKKSEQARPGFYAVTLTNGAVGVELTATPHAAIHRYSFPSHSGAVVVDFDHHLFGGTVTAAEAQIDAPNSTIRGKLHHVGQMSGGSGYDVFFEMRARQPWTKSLTWKAGAVSAEGNSVAGAGAGLAIAFENLSAPVEIGVAVSMVSTDGAKKNFEAEIGTRGFEEVRRTTETAWRELLSTVQISGGTEDDRHTFYSSLYHAFLMPTVQSDADGAYRALDGVIRTAEGFHYCTDLSLWDTYRTLHPLYAIVAREKALDAVRSLLAMAQATGAFPSWPVGTTDARSMPGASAEIVVADAALKGITDFDLKAAYAIARASALDSTMSADARGGRGRQNADYDRLGFLPAEAGGTVSVTAEYSADDHALAALATLVGETADATRLNARSLGYRKQFDVASGFLRGHLADGTLREAPFDPLEWGYDYVEANAWQSVWAAQHDPAGLTALFGGRDAFVTKLESFFEQARSEADVLAGTKPDDLRRAGPRPYYFAGNEPDFHAPTLFAAVGRPDLTQRWVRWAMARWYGPGADGLPGNDDGGTMSAWYVFSALGFFPVPATDRYLVGAPLFTRARIAVAGGTFTVEAPNASAENHFVQSVTLNGTPLDTPLFHHRDLKPGGVLHFELGSAPTSWGTLAQIATE